MPSLIPIVYWLGPKPPIDSEVWGQVIQSFGSVNSDVSGTRCVLSWFGATPPTGLPAGQFYCDDPAAGTIFRIKDLNAVINSEDWTGEPYEPPAVPSFRARAVAHGATASREGLFAWDPDAASPRLHRIDTIGAKGFLAREAWYRIADVDTSGLADVPVPGAVPVYAIEYPIWHYGTFATGLRGITGRERERVWYAEDGTEALRLVDSEPKPYSISTSTTAGQRRRGNVVDVRLTGIVVQALAAIFPGEDPGPRAAALLGALDGAVRGYRSTGEYLGAALADPATAAAFPWLVADLGGHSALDLMLGEIAEPAIGDINP